MARLHRALLAAAGVAAGAAAVAAVRAGSGALRRLDLHVAPRTMFGPAFVYNVRDAEGEPVRVLNVGGGYQSVTYLGDRWAEPALAYYRAFDRMFEAETARTDHADTSCDGGEEAACAGSDSAGAFRIRRVLMLGGGGCSYPKHLLMTRPGVLIDVVERDPAVIALARRFFFVDRLEEELAQRGEQDRFRLIAADALAFLQAGDDRYDVVVNDVYAGTSAVPGLNGAAAARLAKSRLNPGGLYLSNAVAEPSEEGYAALLGYARELEDVFRHVHVVAASDEDFGGEDNYLVIATDGAYAFSDVIPFAGEGSR